MHTPRPITLAVLLLLATLSPPAHAEEAASVPPQQSKAPWELQECLDCIQNVQTHELKLDANGDPVLDANGHPIWVKLDLPPKPTADDADPIVTLTETSVKIVFPQIEKKTLEYGTTSGPRNIAPLIKGDVTRDIGGGGKAIINGGGEGFKGHPLGVINYIAGNQVHDGTGIALPSAMRIAYARHIPLVIRPDDVWVNINSNIAAYILDNAEEYRNRFVDFDGKQALVLEHPLGNDIEPTPELVDSFIEEMTQLAGQSVKDDMTAWLLPDFTTTRKEDVLVSRLAFMSAMSSYFEYIAGGILCGLPEVTLEGTVEDWEKLRHKADNIAGLGGDLAEWSKLLLPVLDKMVAARKGEADFQFWQTIVAGNISYGCGGPPEVAVYGWSAVFAPFEKFESHEVVMDEQGNPVMEMVERRKRTRSGVETVSVSQPKRKMVERLRYQLMPAEKVAENGHYGSVEANDTSVSLISVDVTLIDPETETLRKVKLAGGGLRSVYDASANTVRPITEWAMFEIERRQATADDLPPGDSCTHITDPDADHGELRLRCTELPANSK